MSTNAIQTLLRQEHTEPQQGKTELFTGLSEPSLQALLTNSHIRNFRIRQEILAHGDKVNYLYYILSGAARTVRYGHDGQETTARMLLPGDTILSEAIFTDGRSPVDVQALERSKVLLLAVDVIREHILLDPQLAANLLQIVATQYRSALQQIDIVLNRPPLERLGYYLLGLYLKNEARSLTIDLPFRKSVIASHLGMTPETFSRALNGIRAMDVRVKHKKLTLGDAYALCRFCDADTMGFCPLYGAPGCRFATRQ